MFRTKRAASAWVERERVVVREGFFGFFATHPGYALKAFGDTYLEAVNALITAIDDARASDARARESEIPW